MFTVVAGTGYTGRRVLERLPADAALGLSRSPIDTDRPFHVFDFDQSQALPVDLPDDYALLYTCPPDGEGDERLRRFLSLLDPAPIRIVYISTTGVYGDAKGQVVTESSAVDPANSMATATPGSDKRILRIPDKGELKDITALSVTGRRRP